MKLTVPIKIDGLPFIKKVICDLFDTSEFKDDVHEEYRKGAYEFGQAIINTLDKLDGTGGWIPCSERLPERDVDVLVTDRVTGEVTTAHLNDFDCFVFEDGRGHGANAWMPLPEPYKESD